MVSAIQILEDGYDKTITLISGVSPTQIAVATIGTAVVIGGGILAVTSRKKKTSKKRKTKRRTKRGWSRDRKFRSKQKHEIAYVRKKRKLGKKITRPKYKTKTKTRKSKKRVGKLYYTKKGQPYKIMSSGKARFVKKSKGGKK